MPYIGRDTQGRITTVSREPGPGLLEIPADDSALKDYIREMGLEGNSLEQSDMRLVRVLEDLIDLLIERDLIRFTDLPLPAQEKLLERRSMRQSLRALDLLGRSDDTI